MQTLITTRDRGQPSAFNWYWTRFGWTRSRASDVPPEPEPDFVQIQLDAVVTSHNLRAEA